MLKPKEISKQSGRIRCLIVIRKIALAILVFVILVYLFICVVGVHFQDKPTNISDEINAALRVTPADNIVDMRTLTGNRGWDTLHNRKLYSHVCTNCDAVKISGVFTELSRKSLSPVTSIATPAFNAERRIGRSLISLIFDSSALGASSDVSVTKS